MDEATGPCASICGDWERGFADYEHRTNVGEPTYKPLPDPLWDHKPTTWLIDMGLQVLLAVVFTLITWRRLVRLSPGRLRR